MTVFFDYAASAPIKPAALSAFLSAAESGGNASSLHLVGRKARAVLETARESLAKSLACRPSEIIFTSSGTEANNLAIKGVYWARQKDASRPIIVVSSVEHPAVLEPAQWLATTGAQLVEIPVDATGIIDLEFLTELVASRGEQIAVISVMWANNEVGTVQSLAQVVEIAEKAGIPVHSDAVQAVGSVPVSFAGSGLSAITVSGHKFGAPIGVGALVARRELSFTSVLHGGGQERQVRSGTLNPAAASAMAAALAESESTLLTDAVKIAELRNYLVEKLLAAVPTARFQGSAELSVTENLLEESETGSGRLSRLPGNAHFVFPGCEGDSLLYLLDSAGFSVSTGSACHAGVPQPSHVLLAMGLSENDARGALRFSLGNKNSKEDVDSLVAVLPELVARAEKAGLAAG